jgi:alkanesulfonate monooxygenase SsuD/methylene tetrahydromethanopterin reductase-like flavin-dependent oxidoreductase (luciferase family)
VPTPPIWTGSVGPKSLAVTGRLADGWIPPRASDWLSPLYRQSRPQIDEAAAAAGRDPAEIITVYNFGGRITPEPLAATRDHDGRWIGGSVQQWTEELTAAVLEHHAGGFLYHSTDDTPAAEALTRWAQEIVPAVREGIAKQLGVPQQPATVWTNHAAWASALSAAASTPGCSAKSCHMRGHRV